MMKITFPRITGLIVFVALLLRLPGLNESFWLDEAAQALESRRPLSQQFDIIPDFQPPLYHLLVHGVTLLSQREWVLRQASLLPALLSFIFLMRLGFLLGGPFVGLVSGLLLATSQYHSFYSQELRPYSLAAAFATVSLYYLYRYLKTPKYRFLLLVTIMNTLGLYTMYLYPFWMAAQLAVVGGRARSHLKPLVTSFLVNVIIFLPWLPTFLLQLRGGTGLINQLPGWAYSVSPPLLKMIPLTLVKLTFGRIALDYNLPDLLPLVLLAAAIILALYRARTDQAFVGLLELIVVPIGLAWLVSLVIPVLDPKRVLYVLYPLYLLIALGLKNHPHRLVLLGMLLLLNLYAHYRSFADPLNRREPWREAIAQIQADTISRTSIIVFAFAEPFAPFTWYADQSSATLSLVPRDLTPQVLHAKLSQSASYTDVYVFDYLMDLTDPKREIHSWLITHGLVESRLYDYPGIGFIRGYERPEVFASTLSSLVR